MFKKIFGAGEPAPATKLSFHCMLNLWNVDGLFTEVIFKDDEDGNQVLAKLYPDIAKRELQIKPDEFPEREAMYGREFRRDVQFSNGVISDVVNHDTVYVCALSEYIHSKHGHLLSEQYRNGTIELSPEQVVIRYGDGTSVRVSKFPTELVQQFYSLIWNEPFRSIAILRFPNEIQEALGGTAVGSVFNGFLNIESEERDIGLVKSFPKGIDLVSSIQGFETHLEGMISGEKNSAFRRQLSNLLARWRVFKETGLCLSRNSKGSCGTVLRGRYFELAIVPHEVVGRIERND